MLDINCVAVSLLSTVVQVWELRRGDNLGKFLAKGFFCPKPEPLPP